MCGLFGFTTYSNNKRSYSKLLNALANEASERGTHASGIAYNKNGYLTIYKKPLPAYKLKFEHAGDVVAVMGHTRHATQGAVKDNYNNHPFYGECKNGTGFAMAHNGIIYNDSQLRRTERLPASKIKTDSYIYAQLIEKQKRLDFNTLASCTERLQGYYTFTLLDDKNNLFIVKGDSPLSIIHFTRLKLYAYGSTDEILYKAIIDGGLLDELKTGAFENIRIDDGELMKIDASGNITRSTFKATTTRYSFKNWYEYGDELVDDEYLADLKQTASSLGFLPEDIDQLIEDGFTTDEIEELIYTDGYYADSIYDSLYGSEVLY